MQSVYLSFLRLAGVRQFAWVYASGLRGRDMAEDSVQQFPRELELALFADTEQAVTWLQKTGVHYSSGCSVLPRSAATEAQLAQLVQHFGERLHAAATAG